MKKKTNKFPTIKADKLIPYAKNSRTHSDEQVAQIAASIKEFGFTNPIIIDEDNGIIAGHGRVMAANKLGLEEVPCVQVSGWSEAQKKAYVIADNKLALNAGWDEKMLSLELADLQELDFDLSLTGFNDDELSVLLEPDEVEGLTDEDAVPELTDDPVSIEGDIWLLGDHRLMCGDSTDVGSVALLMDGQRADMVFTDPPYELDTNGGGVLKSANSMKQIKKNGVDTFDPNCLEMYAETNIFCHNKPLIKKYIELSEKHKKSYDLCFYKKKNTAPNYGGHMMTDTEYIAIIGKQSPNGGLQKEMYSKCFIGEKDFDNKLSYSKPVALCEKYIRLYSKNSVLDSFGGSGSTLIACEKTGRKCYMMELDPKYVDVIIKRWEGFTGKKATHAESGKSYKELGQERGSLKIDEAA